MGFVFIKYHEILLIWQFKKFFAGRTLFRIDLFINEFKCRETNFAAYDYRSIIVYLNLAVYKFLL